MGHYLVFWIYPSLLASILMSQWLWIFSYCSYVSSYWILLFHRAFLLCASLPLSNLIYWSHFIRLSLVILSEGVHSILSIFITFYHYYWLWSPKAIHLYAVDWLYPQFLVDCNWLTACMIANPTIYHFDISPRCSNLLHSNNCVASTHTNFCMVSTCIHSAASNAAMSIVLLQWYLLWL